MCNPRWLILGLLACTPPSQDKPAQQQVATSAPEVHFSPRGGCEEAVVRHINATKSTLLVQAYSFTSKPIGDALIRAQMRGVKVQVILDKSDVHGLKTEYPEFISAKVPTFIDGKHPIAHNKVMVYDGTSLMTGSFNFTQQAEHGNAENCLFLVDSTLATAYTENWEKHKAHSPAPSTE